MGAKKYPYDLLKEAEIIRHQLIEDPNTIINARNMGTMAILSKVLLALSDCGFYEYVRNTERFSIDQSIRDLDLDSVTFRALLGHLVGLGFLTVDGDECLITKSGNRVLNVYTRGMVNMYEGAYHNIFSNLSEILMKKIKLGDTALKRSEFHTAAGTAFLTCGVTIPDVFKAIEDHSCRYLLDLGCGTGDFLIQYLRNNPQSRAIGIDMAPIAIEQAKKNARDFRVDDRVTFHVAKVGADHLAIPEAELARVDMVSSMYMIHEFGRDGRSAIVEIIKTLKKQLSGRLFLMLEVEGCKPEEFAKQKNVHKGKLDYLLIHILSGQGLPLPPVEWHEIFKDSDCQIVEKGIKTGGSYIYIIKF